ncbi:hypothetical protein FCL47_22370 [Desulfopila sp. IMCC35006]|uniref:hypothetical protein n=1 Tax=Desulfopila sp. IMCC35006 TaxID=2569542 RepID=UPI0010ABC248|nr:hypothetical protein [Desulfopila sp. IMCC35006]TKB23502.1 hypothetical protein FCL47_22370 [Desulfopila sp. IMCC35006]
MEFSLEFSKRLIEAAESLSQVKPVEPDTDRAILYLSLVSCEISIKALLEKAGYSLKEIKGMSHKFAKLKKALSTCDFKGDKKGSAAKLFAESPDKQVPYMTVGKLLDFEQEKASMFPNQVRYGSSIKNYPPTLMLKCAKKVNKWAFKNISFIKRKKKHQNESKHMRPAIIPKGHK